MKAVTALIAGMLLLAACSPGAPSATPPASAGPTGAATPVPSSAPSSPAAEFDEETVAVGSALAQMRGHHLASLELHRADDLGGALAHASHPAAEILESIRGDLDEADAPTEELASALEAVLLAAENGSTADLEAAISAATEQIDAAERAVAGDAFDDPAYRGSVIAALLQTAGHEYEEAVSDGAIGELIEYQDAWAFTTEANTQYMTIRDVVTVRAAHEAEEIDEAFEQLFTALVGVQPPTTIVPVEDVVAAAALIGHELEEVVGALAVSEADPAAEQQAIEALLDQIVELVGSGDRAAAAELAAEAYLEHYEVIEGAVLAAAPDINTELEPLLGAELRRQINEGATLEEIQTMVDRAKVLLGQAIEALEHH